MSHTYFRPPYWMQRLSFLCIMIGFLLLAGQHQVAAQTPEGVNTEAARKEARKKLDALTATAYEASIKTYVEGYATFHASQKLDAPVTNAALSSLVSPFSNVALSTTTAGQEASARLSVPFIVKSHKFENIPCQFSAAVKQPFQDKLTRVTPLSLDGLSQGASATFSLQFNGTMRLNLKAITRKLGRTVVKDKLADKLTTVGMTSLFGTETNLSTEDFRLLEKLGLLRTSPWLAGATYSIGKVQYDYIADANAKAPEHLDGLNYNLRGYVAHTLGNTATLALSATYQNQYKTVADDPISFTYPLSSTNNTFTAKDVYLGTPTSSNRCRLSLEGRFQVKYPDKPEKEPFLAINPSVSLVTNTQRLAFNSAFYFLKVDPPKKPEEGEPAGPIPSRLQGGIAVGYITAEKFGSQSFAKGVSAEVFIAMPFDLFGFR